MFKAIILIFSFLQIFFILAIRPVPIRDNFFFRQTIYKSLFT